MKVTVFVVNLPFKFSEADVKELFYFSGTIKALKLITSEEGSSLGMALIRFKDEKEALKVVEKHNKTEVKGRMISVRLADENIK